MEINQAKNYALRRLTLRAMTKKELHDALIKKGASSQVADKTVKLLEKYGYLNDRAWAESFIRGQQRKGAGPHMINQKLRNKGIPAKIAEPLLKKASKSQKAQIQAFLAKKKPNLEDFKERQKTAAALYRKGFDSDAIQDALNLY